MNPRISDLGIQNFRIKGFVNLIVNAILNKKNFKNPFFKGQKGKYLKKIKLKC